VLRVWTTRVKFVEAAKGLRSAALDGGLFCIQIYVPWADMPVGLLKYLKF